MIVTGAKVPDGYKPVGWSESLNSGFAVKTGSLADKFHIPLGRFCALTQNGTKAVDISTSTLQKRAP